MTATNLDPDVVTMTDAVLDQLVIDINAGGTGAYRIVQTRTYSARTAPLPQTGWTTNTDDHFEVTFTDKGKVIKVATLYIRDGALTSVLVERDVAFHLVPRALRAVAG